MGFQKKLLKWFDENRRSFPWRENKEPYNVWLSEIILQQTRTAQGLPYYESFLSAFPTVTALAKASEDQVMKLWQGLGYYSRARNLHATAQQITEQYDGKFPNDFDQIKSLKGIGDYTWKAIISLAFKPLDWNHFKVRIKDDHIQSWINGVMIGDVYDDLTDNGYIALQLHGIGRKALKVNKKIRWKNLVLTEL